MRQVFHISRVWGSRHGGSFYSRAIVEVFVERGWKVTVLAESFMGSAEPGQPAQLRGFFQRELLSWHRRLSDIFRIFRLAWATPEPLVVVQGDLPRVSYLVLQWMTPLIFIRQDGILTCPANNRFLPRSRKVCRRRVGLGCLRMHRIEGCMEGLSLVKRAGRLAFRIRDRLLLRCVRHSVTSSRYLAQVHGRSARVLYPPLVTTKLKSESSHLKEDGTASGLRERLATVSRDLHKLVFCGRLDAVKGPSDAIRMVSLLPERYYLEIVGDGVERTRLRILAEELGVGRRVKFLGWLDGQNRDAVLSSGGAMVVPSLWDEGFGMVGIEALAQGTPVVAYDVGGISEWCCDGAGVLVPCGDVQRAAKSIREMTEDPATWQIYSRAATKMAEKFEEERFGRELAEVVEEVTGGMNRSKLR